MFYDLLARENLALPWREILWAFRRMEARGLIRGGRFVTGFVGEQFALPEAVSAVRRIRKTQRTGEVVRLSAADPLNLVGILTDGPRIPAIRTHQVCYRDGAPFLAEGTPFLPEGTPFLPEGTPLPPEGTPLPPEGAEGERDATAEADSG